MRNVILLLACLWLGGVPAWSQRGADGVVLPEELQSVEVTEQMADADGFMWFGTLGNGLCRWDGYHTYFFRSDTAHPDLLGSNDVMHLAECTQARAIWLGTKMGAYVLQQRDGSISPLRLRGPGTTPDELADKRIGCLFAQRDGTMWVAYRNHLLHLRSDGTLLQRFQTRWTGHNRSVEAAVEQGGQMYFALWNGGVMRFDGTQLVPDGEDKSRFQADTAAQAGPRLRTALPKYAVLSRGLPPDAFDTNVLSEAESDSGDLYVGTYRSLYQVDKSGNVRRLATDLGRVHDVCAAPSGVYFLSNRRGVCQLQNGVVQTLSAEKGFMSMALDGDSVLWLSNKLGRVASLPLKPLGALREDTLASQANGDELRMIRFDQWGHLWLLSNRTLREYNPRSGCLRAVACGSKWLPVALPFALRPDSDGVWVENAEQGAYVPRLADLDNRVSQLRPAVSAFAISDSLHLLSAALDTAFLRSNERELEVQLTAFDYAHAADLRFAYRIKNNSNSWTELAGGEHVIHLRGIKSGASVLQVKVQDALGRWSDARDVLVLVRQPAWHELAWVRLLALLLLLGALTALFFVWKKRHKERQLLREQAALWLRHLAEADQGNDAAEAEEPQGLSEGDREFIDRAYAMAKQNLANETYSMDQFASDMCMSRANLYRKMKALVGQSPSDFLRDQRLERAAELLRSGKKSVSEVAAAVGFAYTNYFAKCFKDKYGTSPKDFA